MPTDQPNDENRIEELPLALIDPDPTNVRADLRPLCRDDELARSLAQVGLLHPIVVTRTDDGRYTVVVGHRRRQAALALGWDTIATRVMPDIDAQAAQFAENEWRAAVNPADKARWVAHLVETEGTQAKAAERLGLKRAMVGRYVAIAQGPAYVSRLLSEGHWTLEQAYEAAVAYRNLATRPSDDVLAEIDADIPRWLAAGRTVTPVDVLTAIADTAEPRADETELDARDALAVDTEAEARSARARQAAETRREQRPPLAIVAAEADPERESASPTSAPPAIPAPRRPPGPSPLPPLPPTPPAPRPARPADWHRSACDYVADGLRLIASRIETWDDWAWVTQGAARPARREREIRAVASRGEFTVADDVEMALHDVGETVTMLLASLAPNPTAVAMYADDDLDRYVGVENLTNSLREVLDAVGNVEEAFPTRRGR